ncbi:MAG: hypothetical protein ACOC36_00545 [Fibrobacterota bacterium]
MTKEVKNSLIPVDKQERLEKALQFLGEIESVKIRNQSEYESADELCKKVKTGFNSLEKDRKELVKPYKDKASAIDKEYKVVKDKLLNAESALKKAMGKFYKEQELKRQEEQRKLEAEAEEKRRKAEERAEAERLKAEQYRQQGREDMAQKAEARAETAEAKATEVVAPVVENTAKVSGTSFRTVYKVAVINEQRAIQSMASNSFMVQFLSIDVNALEKMVNFQKGKVTLPDGLLIQEGTSVAVRAS